MINIVLFGPPGSGKGTQSALLAQKYQLVSISTGDIFRYNIKNETALGKEAKSYMDKGLLVPDELTSGMLLQEIKKLPAHTQGVLFDGFPRNIHQAEVLDAMLADLGQKIDLTLSLKVDDNLLVERIVERGKTSGRSDDTPEIVRLRIKEYYDKTLEVAGFYKKQNKLVEVQGVGSIADITASLALEIEKLL